MAILQNLRKRFPILDRNVPTGPETVGLLTPASLAAQEKHGKHTTIYNQNGLPVANVYDGQFDVLILPEQMDREAAHTQDIALGKVAAAQRK